MTNASRTTMLFFIFALIGTMVRTTSAAPATIDTIKPRTGSVNGETRVSILGTGFDIRGRSNDVFIGSGKDGVFCDPVPNECHEKRIVCLTPAASFQGAKTLTVKSFGQLATCQISGGTGCTFEFTPQATPKVQRVVPEWVMPRTSSSTGLAPTQIDVYGAGFTNGDQSEGRFDFTMWIGDEERCELQGDVQGNTFKCNVAPMYAGTHKMTVIMGDSGKASWADKAATLAVYPSVSGVSPVVGSVEGGQLITVLGTSFSKELTDNIITVNGRPCIAKEYLDSGIVCLTSAVSPATVLGLPVKPVWQQGKMAVDSWYDIDGVDITNDLVGRIKYDFPSESDMTNGLEKPRSCNRCGMRWTSFFKPNITGEHQFFVAGDDSVSLWLSESEDPVFYEKTAVRKEDQFNARMIASSPRSTWDWQNTEKYGKATSEFSLYPSQTSAMITLEKGKYYWMQIFMKEHDGSDYVRVEVKHPSGVQTTLKPAYLAYRPPYVPVVKAIVRGLTAKYTAECLPFGSCHFDYAETSTSTLSSVTPTQTTGGDLITITGTNFPAKCSALTITTNNIECIVASCSSTQAICKIGAVSSGNAVVKVNVNSIGNARGTLEVKIVTKITAVSPAVGSIAGGSIIEIKGSGFGISKDDNKTKVTIDNKPCTLEQVLPNSILCRVPAANETDKDTKGNIEIKIEESKKTTTTNGFNYEGKFDRPGTTTEDTKPSAIPAFGSLNGGTRVTITGSVFNRVYTSSQIKVIIGTSSCMLSLSLPGRVECLAGTSEQTGLSDILVTIPESDIVSPNGPTSNGPNKTIVIAKAFSYVPTFTEMQPLFPCPWCGGPPRFSVWGGAILTIQGVSIKDPKSVRVDFEGVTLNSWTIGTNIYSTIPQRTTANDPKPLPSLERFDFKTNPFSRLAFYDDLEATYNAQSGSIKIPTGNNFIASKKAFTRPFTFQATVMATGASLSGGDCIVMRVFPTDHTYRWSGYTISANPERGTFNYGIGGWVRETGTNEDWPKITAGSKMVWRIEVLNDFISFYLNDVFILTFADSSVQSGIIGFGQSCQDSIIYDMEVLDSSARALRITVDGNPITPLRRDAMYDAIVLPDIVSVSKQSFLTGDLITIMGKNFHTEDWEKGFNKFLLTADLNTREVSSDSESLCVEISRVVDLSALGQGKGVVCKVGAVTAGSRYVRVQTKYGYSAPANALTVIFGTEVKSVAPIATGSEGSILTIVGAGFPSTNPTTIGVLVGTQACVIQIVTLTAVTCLAPKLADGKYIVSIKVANVDVRCSGTCELTYKAVTTGRVTEISPLSGLRDTRVVIRGNNFTTSILNTKSQINIANCEVKIGETDCTCTEVDKDYIVCYIQTPQALGSFPVTVMTNGGIAIVPAIKFTFVQAVQSISPVQGSTEGGTILSLMGNSFLSETWQTSTQLSYDFKLGKAQSGWTGTSTTLTYCELHGGMLGGYNQFGVSAKISRTFELPTHKRLRVRVRILAIDSWDGENFQVLLDGKVASTQYRSGPLWGTSCFPLTQCGSASGDCYIDTDFAIPHSAASVVVTLRSNLDSEATDESWGLMNYALYYSDSDDNSVTIGGKPCPIISTDKNSVTCRAPNMGAQASAETATAVELKKGGVVVPCLTPEACVYNYKIAQTPVLLALSKDPLRTATTSELTFDAEPCVIVEKIDGKVRLTSNTTVVDGWNCGTFGKDFYTKNSNFGGIQFRAARTQQYTMVGLNSGSNGHQSYWDLDYAIYMEGETIKVYEQGRQMGTFAQYTPNTIFSVVYDRQCDCIIYKADNTVIYTSTLEIVWPLFIDTSFNGRNANMVDQLQVLVNDQKSQNFIVFGKVFGESATTVSIDGAPCNPYRIAPGKLWCSIPAASDNVIGTAYSVQLSTPLGSSAAKSLVLGAVISSIFPAIGSIRGGQTVVISGAGIMSEKATVMFGPKKGIVLSTNETSITVMTPPLEVGQYDVSVTVKGMDATCGVIRCSYNATVNPTEAKITGDASTKTPKTESAVKIMGTFNTSSLRPMIVFTRNGTVRASVPASAMSETEVSFSAPDLEAGKYEMQVVFAEGAAVALAPLEMNYAVSDVTVTPKEIGSAGGAVLTFTAGGLGSSSDIAITFGGQALCKSITRTVANTVECVTNPMLVNGDVTVTVEGVSGTASGLTASNSAAPTFTEIIPNQGAQGDMVIIKGTNLGLTTSVRIGTAICTYVFSSATSIAVRIAGAAGSGSTNNIEVVTKDRGTATRGPAAFFTFVLSIFTVQPTTGPKSGGTLLTITGNGFGTNASGVKVMVGASECAVKSCTEDVIECVTGKMVEDTGAVSNITVERISQDASPTGTIADQQYSFEVAKTPVVTSFSPLVGSAAGGTYVTIMGRNLGADIDANQVRIGNTDCVVTFVSLTRDTVICMTKAQKPQSGCKVQVLVASFGGSNATTTDTYTYEMSITSVAPAGGSVQGGTKITITGVGFGAFTGNYTTVNVGGSLCAVTASSYTQIVCTTPASMRQFITPLWRMDLNPIKVLPKSKLVTEHTIRPDGPVNVVVTINETTTSPCKDCFLYAAAQTPTITNVMPKYVWPGQVFGQTYLGDILTITGTNFGTAPKVKVGTGNCPVESATATEIKCKLTEPNVGMSRLTVETEAGTSYTKLTCGAGKYLACDGTCFGDDVCAYDAWSVNNCAALYNTMVPDTFCHSNGGSDRVASSGFKTDAKVELNFNCPMYDCEGQDCNTTLSVGGRSAVVSTCGVDPNGFMIDYRPKIVSMSPTSSSRAGGQNVTITGTNLGALGKTTITLGASWCVPLEVSSTQIICASSATTEKTVNAVVRVGTVVATCSVCEFTFTDAKTPLIDDLVGLRDKNTKALTAFGRGGKDLTIVGTNFQQVDVRVVIGPKLCVVLSVNATAVVCKMPLLVADTYPITVQFAGMGYGAFTDAYKWSSTPIRYELEVASLTVDGSNNQEGSVAGGTAVTIEAYGFRDTTQLKWIVDASTFSEWTIVSSKDNIIKAITGPGLTGQAKPATLLDGTTLSSCRGNIPLACRFVYSNDATPVIISVNASAITAGRDTTPLMISANTKGLSTPNVTVSIGENDCVFSSIAPSIDSTAILCSVNNTMQGGTYKVQVKVAPFGFAAKAANLATHPTITFPVSISGISPTAGSIGGGTKLVISGAGFPDTATNAIVTINGVACVVTESKRVYIACTTGAGVEGQFVVNVTINSKLGGIVSTVATEKFDYSAALTPTITSVNPWRGSTAGGTEITITGTRLNLASKITIDNIECVTTATQRSRGDASNIFCNTGAHPITFSSTVKVATTNGDAVAVSARYDYVDLWSRWTTWGGLPPPVQGDSAVISEGQHVVLDYSPPRLHLIIVMGHLRADDVDLVLQATYIMVNFGRLTVGTPEKPFKNKFTFTLFGDRLTPEIPVHGAKVLALRHGALDLHGIKRTPTWTLIVRTANVGDTSIAIKGPVDWVAGEKIVLSSTDYEKEHAEERIISFVTDATSNTVLIEFEKPLLYMHFGEIQCFEGNCVDERAAVGHFTRNIVVEGDSISRRIGFGGTMFLMPKGQDKDMYARLSFVEFRDVGQQYIVGRYPVHFHVTGDANNSYVNGTSVYRSLNRAFSIHGINNNTYVDNVGYDIAGHAVFLEDGSERFNVIKHNLMMVARVSTSNLNTDLTPATFWIVSPTNWYEDNHAGGSGAYGFWISPFHPQATGPSGGPHICPASHPMWFFERNVAHSNGKYGLNIFRFWWPKKVECKFDSEDAPAVIRDFTTFKNQIHGITMGNQEVGNVGAVTVQRLISADNGQVHDDASAFWIEHITASNQSCGIRDSVLMATTNNSPFRRQNRRRAVNLPLHDNFFVENVTFINYNGENFGFEPQAWANRLSLCFPYAWPSVLRGLKWINSPNRVLFRFQHHGILEDDDGTLGGLAGSQIVPYATIYDPKICIPITGFVAAPHRAVRCPQSYKIRRTGVTSMSEIFLDQKWTCEGQEEIFPMIDRQYIGTMAVNQVVNINFQHWYNPQWWSWAWGSTRYNRDGESIVFTTRYNETRDHINVNLGILSLLNKENPLLFKENGATFPTITTPGVVPYRFDNETGRFAVQLKFPTKSIRVEAHDCPEAGCPAEFADATPERRPCTAWERVDSWTSKTVPASNDDVHVKQPDSICVTPSSTGTVFIKSLRVSGQIYFTCTKGQDLVVNVDKWIWIQGGILDIGSKANPIKDCKVTINLGKPLLSKADSTYRTLMPWGIRVLALEYGEFNVYGDTPLVTNTNLAATALAGTRTLTLIKAVDWKAGQYLALASTQRDFMYIKDSERTDQTEKVIIDAVSADGLTLTLKANLLFTHYGSLKVVMNGRAFYPGAEVALMDRNVVLAGGHSENEEPTFRVGWQFVVGCTTEGYEGCVKSKAGTNGWPMHTAKLGLLNVNGAQFRNVGQSGRPYGGINIDGLVSNVDGTATGSAIRNCAIVESYTTAINIPRSTTKLVFANNLIVNVSGDGVMVAGANNTISNNIVMHSYRPMPQCEKVYDIFWDCRVSAYRVKGGNILTGNVAASGDAIGFLTDGDACGNSLWSNNYAHSFRDGVLVADYPAINHMGKSIWGEPNYFTRRTDAFCRQVTGVTTYWNADHGFVAWYALGNVVFRDIVSVDNQIGLTSIQLFSDAHNMEGTPTLNVTTATFANRWSKTDACRAPLIHPCRSTLAHTEHWCRFWIEDEETSPKAKIGNVGIMQSSFVTKLVGITKGEHKFIWHEPDSYATIKGQATFDNIFFDHWDGADACGVKNVALYGNQYSNNSFAQHTFSGVTWGDGMKNDGELYARTTYGKGRTTIATEGLKEHEQTYYMDFDHEKFGGKWPDAPNHFFIGDKDGSFSKRQGLTAIVNSLSLVSPTIFKKIQWNGKAFVEGAGILEPARSECTWNKNWNAYACKNVKYVTIAIDSLAEDAMTRRPGPVLVCRGDGMIDEAGIPICQGGFVDISSGSTSQGKPHRATLDRPSRYYFIVENNNNYTLAFRGQPPTWMRVWLLNDEWLGERAGVVLKLRYFGLNSASRVGVYVNKIRVRPEFGFGIPEAMNPPQMAPQPFDPPGTHYHNKFTNSTMGYAGLQTNVLSFTVRPGSYIDLKQEPIIQVSMAVAMDEEDFFNNKATFALAMANVLGIDSSRIRFANIVAGSKKMSKGFNILAASTKVSLEIEDAAASSTEGPGASATTDLKAVMGQVDKVSANPALLTEATKALNKTMAVSGMSAQFASVTIQRQPLKMTSGTPYIELNMTHSSNNFSAVDIGAHVAAWVTSKYPNTIPYNTTLDSEFYVGQVFTDATGTTSCVFVFSYESNNDIIFAAQDLFKSLMDRSYAFPVGYAVVGVAQYQQNAAAIQTPVPTPVPNVVTAVPVVTSINSVPLTTAAPGVATPAATVPGATTDPSQATKANTVPTTVAANPSAIGTATRGPNTESATNTGAIAGGVVGGIVAIAAIGGIAYYIHQRRIAKDGIGASDAPLPGSGVMPNPMASNFPPTTKSMQSPRAGSQSPANKFATPAALPPAV